MREQVEITFWGRSYMPASSATVAKCCYRTVMHVGNFSRTQHNFPSVMPACGAVAVSTSHLCSVILFLFILRLVSCSGDDKSNHRHAATAVEQYRDQFHFVSYSVRHTGSVLYAPDCDVPGLASEVLHAVQEHWLRNLRNNNLYSPSTGRTCGIQLMLQIQFNPIQFICDRARKRT